MKQVDLDLLDGLDEIETLTTDRAIALSRRAEDLRLDGLRTSGGRAISSPPRRAGSLDLGDAVLLSAVPIPRK